MRFQITAYHPQQGLVSLACDAGSLEQAKLQATDQGLEVVSIEQRWTRYQGKRDEGFDLLLFTQEIRALLSAGLSLIEGLGALARKESATRKRDILDGIVRQLKDGKPLSTALRAYPDEFPTLYLALVAASEHTGNIGQALGRFNEYRVQLDGIRKRVVAAMLYPSLLLGTGGLVVVFLLLYVVPRFTRIYEDFGRQLPWMSRLMMEWGRFVTQHGTLLLCGSAILVGAIAVAMQRHRNDMGNWLRGLPVLADKLGQYELARFYRTTGMLQQGGISLISSMGMAADLLGSNLRDALRRAVLDLRNGQAFSTAMEASGLAPPVALDLLRVGERTGDLGEKMIRIADFYDEEQARWIEWFTRLFEPLLMLAIGILIAFVIVLLYLPIFELAETIK